MLISKLCKEKYAALTHYFPVCKALHKLFVQQKYNLKSNYILTLADFDESGTCSEEVQLHSPPLLKWSDLQEEDLEGEHHCSPPLQRFG